MHIPILQILSFVLLLVLSKDPQLYHLSLTAAFLQLTTILARTYLKTTTMLVNLLQMATLLLSVYILVQYFKKKSDSTKSTPSEPKAVTVEDKDTKLKDVLVISNTLVQLALAYFVYNKYVQERGVEIK